MNTTTISAALPNAAPANDRHRSHSSGEEGGSFSSVLGSQQSAMAQPTPANGREPEGAREHAGDADLAQNAAEQGLTGGQASAAHLPAEAAAAAAKGDALSSRALPQIALQLAAEIAAVQQAVSGRGTIAVKNDTASDARASRLDLRADAAARHAATDTTPRAATALENAVGRLAASTGADQPIRDAASTGLPAAGALPTARSGEDMLLAPSAALLGPARAASIAGAKQAVLTMQARMQTADSTTGAGAQQTFGLPGLNVEDPLARALADLPGNTRMQADVSLTEMQAAPTTVGLNPSSITLGSLVQSAVGGPAVATPLSHPQWGVDFSRQFVALTQGGQNTPHTAELRLDPPELGPLRISINISDNVAHAVFVSPHASVRQTVENSLSQLQQALAQAGISLGEANVSDQGQQAEQAFNERFGNGSSRPSTGFSLDGGSAMESIDAPPLRRATAPDALVDTFA